MLLHRNYGTSVEELGFHREEGARENYETIRENKMCVKNEPPICVRASGVQVLSAEVGVLQIPVYD